MMSVAEWALSLRMQAARVRGHELTLEVEHTLGHIASDARDKIGRENNGWQELAPSTLKEKEAKGFTGQRSESDPLLRTGVLESSIGAQADRRGLTVKGVVGSDDDVAVFHEFGTSRMPPRPFLGPSLNEGQHVIEESMGQFVVRVLMNRE